MPNSPTIFESSRFALDTSSELEKADNGIARATYELFAGMIEFALAHSLTEIITVTDVCMERILRRAHWPLRRIGEERHIGKTRAVAGYLEISKDCLARIRRAGGLSGPVLWAPVLRRAA